jgi:competence ComEA-like helix-hairpin-helix protein
LRQEKLAADGCDVALRRDASSPATSGEFPSRRRARRLARRLPSNRLEIQRITRAVAVGLLCGLALAGTGRGAVAAGAAPAAAGARVNINSAGADELAKLPGIGPAKARAIIEYRSEAPFQKPEDLRKVKGIGDKLYERVKDQITVEPGATPKGRGS